MRRYLVTSYLDVSGEPGRWSTSEVSLVAVGETLQHWPNLVDAIDRLIAAGNRDGGRFKLTLEFNELTDPRGR
jgi:hypothetical protein